LFRRLGSEGGISDDSDTPDVPDVPVLQQKKHCLRSTVREALFEKNCLRRNVLEDWFLKELLLTSDIPDFLDFPDVPDIPIEAVKQLPTIVFKQ